MDQTVLYQLSYGLYAIGVMDGQNPTGCIVNTVFQITSDAPSIAVSINKNNYTMEVLKQNPQFGVSILSEDVPPKLSAIWGFRRVRKIRKNGKICLIACSMGFL